MKEEAKDSMIRVIKYIGMALAYFVLIYGSFMAHPIYRIICIGTLLVLMSSILEEIECQREDIYGLIKRNDMDVKSLMIGDWVMLDSIPKRLTLWDIVEISRGHYETEPIPLTEEILKANGWTEFFYGDYPFDLQRYFRRGEDRRLELSLIKGDNCFCTNLALGRIDFYYANELQHVLRLCGLNELADNFKIK